MAIATHRFASAKDVRDALALVGKVKPRKRRDANADATTVIVTAGGDIVGGTYCDLEVIVRGVFGAGERDQLVSIEQLADAAKGARTVGLGEWDIVRNGDATFTIGRHPDDLALWDGKRASALAAPGDPVGGVMIERAAFVDMVDIVAPHASRDESRPVLTAVHVRSDDDGRVEWGATDSFRACIASCDGSGRIDEGVNIPARALIVAAAAAAKRRDAGGVTIQQSPGGLYASITVGNVEVHAAQQLGQFPDLWKMLAERDPAHSIVTNGDDMDKALAMWGARDSGPALLHLPARHILQRELNVEKVAGPRDMGHVASHRVACDATQAAAEGETIGISPSFLRDCIRSVPGDDVVIAYDGAMRPVLVTSADTVPPYFVACLCMPMRVSA